MVHHQRHVIHGDSAVHISMQQLVSPLPGNDEGVYTWLACKYCDQVSTRVHDSDLCGQCEALVA